MNEQALLLDYLKHYSSLPEFENTEIQEAVEELEEAVAKDEKAPLTVAQHDRLFQLLQPREGVTSSITPTVSDDTPNSPTSSWSMARVQMTWRPGSNFLNYPSHLVDYLHGATKSTKHSARALVYVAEARIRARGEAVRLA